MSKRRSVPFSIKIGARTSPLSRAQVNEIRQLLPDTVAIETVFVTTHGDLDRQTSLRDLDRTDFFTREIDEMVLDGRVDVAVHSAKDLPEPLPKGLVCIAITEGVDPSDALVLRDPSTVHVVATSSERREEAVRGIYPDATFVDVRGTIEERLALLDRDEVDGVVIAEAALIRLGLTNRRRIRLPGETVPYQGQLAVIARQEDRAMEELFAPLESRIVL